MAQPYSAESYGRLLRSIITNGYRVVDFAAFDPATDERQVILRHDIDFIPRLALEMADIEASHGIRSTFFFLVRSHVYNLFSPANAAILEELHRRGHAIALHCAVPPTIPANEHALIRLVEEDLAIARRAFPGVSATFAWHTVAPDFLSRWGGLAVPGFVNAYDARYFSQITFTSDSNARRSPDELEEVLREGPTKIQLLVHPLIWVCGGNTMMEVLSNLWKRLVREMEIELGTNATYRGRLPSGIPDETVESFSAALLADACGRRE